MANAPTSIGDVLSRIATELAALHETALEVQSTGFASATSRACVGLQSLDALTQSLNALSGFTRKLAHAAPACTVDAHPAAADLTLEALRRRLLSEPPIQELCEAGTVDLF